MQDLQEKILSKYDIQVHSYPAGNIESIPSFLKEVDKITSLNDNSIIQLMDCDLICGMSHINQAISQAIKAFDEKQNFAKDRGLEICVRASAQKQISQALKMIGIKNDSNILVVYINTTSEQLEKTEELLSSRNDKLIEEFDEEAVRKVYELNDEEDIINSINEKIALLALKN